MAIQSQTVAQYAGFGNDEQKLAAEYYYGKGVRASGQGLTFGSYLSPFFTSSDFAGLGGVLRMDRGKSLAAYGGIFTVNTAGTYLLLGDSGNNNIYQAFAGVFTPEHVYRVVNQNWFGAGMKVDQKERLLYSGWQYLGMMDSTVLNYRTGTVAVTNGSGAVVGTGTTFAAGDVGKTLRIDGDTGTTSFYAITAFTDATHITIGTYGGTTGSGKGYTIFRSWSDKWKDFGSSITNMADGSAFLSPIEIYESTVLIGRRNNICSLDVTTDTITTDASPAFDMPAGYDNIGISANTNGLLMAFNHSGRGTLVLWDNYSDRSIAPWIPLDDLILGIQRYSSGWIVMTARAVFYTNGYSIQPFLEQFLETSFNQFSGVTQAAFPVIGEDLYFGMSGGLTRLRGGLYRLNLKTKLAEFIGNLSETLYSVGVNTVFYEPSFNRIYVSGTGGVSSLQETSINSSKSFYYISSDVGVGENPKIAEQIRLPIQLTHFRNTKQAITFTIEARINNLDRQLHNFGQVKSNAADTTHMTVDETTWPPAQIGDLVEFVSGSNAGLLRGITAISAGGTNAAIYTLDSALTANPATSDNFVWTGFKPIEKKVVTAAPELFDLYFGIKNKYRGKHFKVMFIVTAATAAIETLPFEFQYDDMGILE